MLNLRFPDLQRITEANQQYGYRNRENAVKKGGIERKS